MQFQAVCGIEGALCRVGKLVGPEYAIVKVDIVTIPVLRAVVIERSSLFATSIVALGVFHL